MKKAALLVAGLFFALTVAAQESKSIVAGNGKIVKEKRDISAFTKITVSGPFEVCLTHSDTGNASLEGDENILAVITTQVINGTLTIASKDNVYVKPSRTNKVKIKIPYTLLENITLNGCGTITSKGVIKSMNLKATVDGPGSIVIAVENTATEAWILGSGSIAVRGATKKFECKIVGAGTINADSLEAKEVSAIISGSGNAKVHSTSILTGRIIGTGNIAFSGEPKKTDLKYMGTGTFNWD